MGQCDYANARLSARRSALLGRRGIEELALCPTTADRLHFLAQRGWPVDAGGDGAAACEALLATAEADGADVLSLVAGRPHALLAAVLRIDDARALKAVFRAILRKDAPARVLAKTARTPGLDVGVLRELASCGGLDRVAAVLARLGSPLAAAAASAVAAASAEPVLLRLETTLDRAVFEGVLPFLSGLDEDSRVARLAVGLHADHANATTALALGARPRDVDLYVPGGLLAPGDLDVAAALPASARGAAVARLLGAAYRGSGLPPEALAEPARAEAALERVRVLLLAREARARPLSIAVPLAYVAARRAEARAARVLLLASDFGLPAGAALDVVEG